MSISINVYTFLCNGFFDIHDSEKRNGIEIAWNRQEMLDVFNNNGYKYKKYPAKAALLKEKYHKFACIDTMDIEHLLRCMRSNEGKEEFTYCFDKKLVYKDCNYEIMHVMDDKNRMENLHKNNKELLQKYDDMI